MLITEFIANHKIIPNVPIYSSHFFTICHTLFRINKYRPSFNKEYMYIRPDSIPICVI